MAIYIKNFNSLFLHVPKTAGTFFVDFLKKDLNLTMIDVGTKHAYRNQVGISSLFTDRFCFIREPFSWYVSYWGKKRKKLGHELCQKGSNLIQYKNNKNYMMEVARKSSIFNDPDESTWHPSWFLDYAAWDVGLEKFIDNVSKNCPGFYTEMIEQYTGCVSKINKIEDVFKYESLNEDIMSFLRKYNIKIDPKIIENKKRIGVSSDLYKKELNYLGSKKTNYLKDKIREVEHVIIDLFY